eukprot:52009-Hanusia_phi.AAC.1
MMMAVILANDGDGSDDKSVNKDVITAAGPNLKIISTMSVGYNHIDLKALADANVLLGYTPDCLTETTADLTTMIPDTSEHKIISYIAGESKLRVTLQTGCSDVGDSQKNRRRRMNEVQKYSYFAKVSQALQAVRKGTWGTWEPLWMCGKDVH